MSQILEKKNTHTCTHACTHAHTHTHTHIYIYIYIYILTYNQGFFLFISRTVVLCSLQFKDLLYLVMGNNCYELLNK